jgi:DNA-binding MarR family transcriptional regulator
MNCPPIAPIAAQATTLCVFFWSLVLADKSKSEEANSSWTFLSNHAQVLLCIAADPEIRMRDVALRVGITERAVQRIVAELEEGGYLTVMRNGRRNQYTVNTSLPLRHALQSHRTLGHLVELGLGGRSKNK